MNFLLHYTIARKISGLYKFSSHRNAIWELGYECDNRKEIENVSFRELDFSDKPAFKGICLFGIKKTNQLVRIDGVQ